MPSPLGIGFSAAGCGPHGPRTLPPTLPWSLGMPGVITSVIAEANALITPMTMVRRNSVG